MSEKMEFECVVEPRHEVFEIARVAVGKVGFALVRKDLPRALAAVRHAFEEIENFKFQITEDSYLDEFLDLDCVSYLNRHHIYQVKQLMQFRISEIKMMDHLGGKRLETLIESLQAHGFEMKN